MVPCLKNIFYELLIARQRSYRRQQICRFQVFPPLTPLFVEMFRTRLRTRYRDLDVFVLSVVGGGSIEVTPGLPDRRHRQSSSQDVQSPSVEATPASARVKQFCDQTTRKRRNFFWLRSAVCVRVDFHALSVL